jgi:hypothetical protein
MDIAELAMSYFFKAVVAMTTSGWSFRFAVGFRPLAVQLLHIAGSVKVVHYAPSKINALIIIYYAPIA